MYLESVTSDQKLKPGPCPSLPQPLRYPPKGKQGTPGAQLLCGERKYLQPSQTMSVHNI